MVKKFKLTRKIFFENLIKNVKEKNDQNFQTRCNFSHKEVTEKIFLKCLVCKNFDFGLESVFSNLKFDFHFPDHLSILKAPNYIPITSLNWNFGEDLRLSNALQQVGNLDWKKVSSYIGSRALFECENHYFDFHLGRRSCDISFFNRLPRDCKRSVIIENQLRFLKIWNVIFENKFNWIPQRGESFFEWKNNVEEKIEKRKFKTKSCMGGYSSLTKILSYYNKSLYEREISKEFFCRVRKFSENIFPKPDFNINFRKSIIRNEYTILLNQNVFLDKGKEEFTKKKKKKQFKNWIEFITFQEIEICQKTLQNFRKVHFFKALERKNSSFLKPKNPKKTKIELDFFLLSAKEKNLCKYIGIFSLQFFFFKTLVFFKKTKLKGLCKLFFGLNPSILLFLNEMMNNFYGLDILRNKIKKLKNY